MSSASVFQFQVFRTELLIPPVLQGQSQSSAFRTNRTETSRAATTKAQEKQTDNVSCNDFSRSFYFIGYNFARSQWQMESSANFVLHQFSNWRPK